MTRGTAERGPRALRDVALRPTPIGGAREQAYALAAMFVAGSLLAALSMVVPVRGELELGVRTAIWLLGVPVGYLLVIRGDQLPRWAFHPLLAAGSVTVAALAWSTGPGTTPVAYATLLVWVALYAGYFFSLAGAAVHGVIAVACYAAVLVRLDQPFGVELFTLAGVAAVVGGVAHWLSHARAQSEVDALTGVANRRGLARQLEHLMADAAANRTPLSLALIDIDDFRRVNRRAGPGSGDQLLVACAQRFTENLPEGGYLARYGGDEFVVVLPGYRLSRAREIVDRLRSDGPAGHSYSAGVAAWAPGDTQSLLVSRADSALYNAKHGGRGFTAVVGHDPDAAAELWSALDAGELELLYQPIHELPQGRLVAVEALVRWAHPVHGWLEPARFIRAAEHSGAIHALGRWVAHEACRQVERWRAMPGWADLGVAINLSTTQLSHPDLVTDLRNALEATGLAPSALTIELTEGAFEGDVDRITQLLTELTSLGLKLAMDDFGTGHSSLARLRSLPFDVLKIDRSFVSGTGDAAPDAALLPAIVAVAQSLGLDTVAEGVEDERQLAFVTEHGCTRAQGFLLDRPLDPSSLEARLCEQQTRTSSRSPGGP